MPYSYCYASVLYTLLLFVATVVRSQTTTLPPPPKYSDGVFTSPNTAATQIFDNGIKLNVTWNTTFSSVNLYIIFGGDYANSQALTCNIA